MNESILNSTKKVLGLAPDDHVFDADVIMLINSAFSTLHQLGIGPLQGFMIEDATATWDSFLLGDNRLNSVKTYVHLKVRSIFDPPATSFVLSAMQTQISELEWRLNVVREGVVYGAPVNNPPVTPPVVVEPDGTLDGGNPSGVLEPPITIYDGGSP
jgi:hypothetical protein